MSGLTNLTETPEQREAREAGWRECFSGLPCAAPWMAHTTHKDWMLDGRSIKADNPVWLGLDWSRAWCDMGPSVAGNPGPYWHVPFPEQETIHRLYPKLLFTKWLTIVRQAVDEEVRRASGKETK